jgi:hypothetical protein
MRQMAIVGLVLAMAGCGGAEVDASPGCRWTAVEYFVASYPSAVSECPAVPPAPGCNVPGPDVIVSANAMGGGVTWPSGPGVVIETSDSGILQSPSTSCVYAVRYVRAQ